MHEYLKVLAMAILLGFVVWGCSSPQQRAQRLFDAGKYEEVLWKYPDSPCAAEARQRIAQQLMEKGDYQRVLERFPDLPIAQKAQVCKALQAAVYGAARVDLVETDSTVTELHIYASEQIHPEATKDKFLEFMTSAAVRLGEWSLHPTWQVGEEMHLHVGMLIYAITLEDCRQAAVRGGLKSMATTTYVMEHARMEYYSTIKLK